MAVLGTGIHGTSTHLADYSDLGLASVVEQDSTEAHLRFTLLSLTGSNDPDTGDIYSGLDRFGRVTDVRWRNTSTNTDLSRVQYGYNRASSRTWRSNSTAPSNNYDWLYGYDGLQRVTSGTRGTLNGTKTGITSPQFGQCWTLDSTGNWQGFKQDDTGGGTWNLEQTRSASPVNEITSLDSSVGESWATPQYDPAGNMTTIPRPGLPRPSWSNLTVAQWSSLTSEQWAQMEVAPKFQGTYDAWNRLVKLTDGGTGQTAEEYQYDGRNYRTVVQSYSAGTLNQTRHAYYTDHWQCVEERLGTSPDTSNPDRQFVWGIRYIDDLVCRDRSLSAGTLNERLYGCQDANWNMTAVVDTSGAVQERYEYDPYGHGTFLSPTLTPRAASSYGWETLYAGYRFDPTSGLYAVRNRYYHPRLGTWLTRDPVGYFSSINLYEYCTSNPQSGTDPSGLWKPGAYSAWGGLNSFSFFSGVTTGIVGLVVGAAVGAAVVGAVAAFSPAVATGLLIAGAAVGGYALGQQIYQASTGTQIDWTGTPTGTTLSTPQRYNLAGQASVGVAALGYQGAMALRARSMADAAEGGAVEAMIVAKSWKKTPKVTTAIRDPRTGRIWTETSNPPKTPRPEPTPAMRPRVDEADTQFPDRDVLAMQCAEARGANAESARLGGETVPNLEYYPIITRTGATMQRCDKCRITTRGSRCYTDLDYIGAMPGPPAAAFVPSALDIAKDLTQ